MVIIAANQAQEANNRPVTCDGKVMSAGDFCVYLRNGSETGRDSYEKLARHAHEQRDLNVTNVAVDSILALGGVLLLTWPWLERPLAASARRRGRHRHQGPTRHRATPGQHSLRRDRQ